MSEWGDPIAGRAAADAMGYAAAIDRRLFVLVRAMLKDGFVLPLEFREWYAAHILNEPFNKPAPDALDKLVFPDRED